MGTLLPLLFVIPEGNLRLHPSTRGGNYLQNKLNFRGISIARCSNSSLVASRTYCGLTLVE